MLKPREFAKAFIDAARLRLRSAYAILNSKDELGEWLGGPVQSGSPVQWGAKTVQTRKAESAGNSAVFQSMSIPEMPRIVVDAYPVAALMQIQVLPVSEFSDAFVEKFYSGLSLELQKNIWVGDIRYNRNDSGGRYVNVVIRSLVLNKEPATLRDICDHMRARLEEWGEGVLPVEYKIRENVMEAPASEPQ